MSARRVTSALVLALLVAVAAPAAAQNPGEEAFKRGLDAHRQRKWAEAATQFRTAIQLNSKESSDKVGSRLGFGGTEYLPFYFLGEVLRQEDDCAGAMEAWGRSEGLGIVRRVPEYFKSMQAGKALCEKLGVLPYGKYEEALNQTKAAVAEAGAAAQGYNEVGRGAAALMSAEHRAQADRARTDLGTANTRFDAATRSRGAKEFEEAGAAAGRAREIFVGLSNELTRLKEADDRRTDAVTAVERLIEGAAALDREIDARLRSVPPTASITSTRARAQDVLRAARGRLTDARAGNEGALNEARRGGVDAETQFRIVLGQINQEELDGDVRRLNGAVRGARERFAFIDNASATYQARAVKRPELVDPSMESEWQTVQSRVQFVRRQLDQAARTNNLASIEAVTKELQQLLSRLNGLIERFGPRTIGELLPETLVQGARLFLEGQYAQAVDALGSMEGLPDNVPLRLHGYLFRAASLHALFLRGRSSDQALRDRAAADVASAKNLDPNFSPNPAAFSPRFLAFFRQEPARQGPSAQAPPGVGTPAAPASEARP